MPSALRVLPLVLSILGSACSTQTAPRSPHTPSNAAEIHAALDHPQRPASDHDIDLRRKPGQVLQHFGIAPGMVVLDMFSGSGYYSELLHYLVGERGKVWAHNNTPYLKWLNKDIEARYTGRLAQIHRFTAENNQWGLPEGKFDAALMILSYHDVYHVHESSGWTPIDGPAMLAAIYAAMKPGAVLGIVDHHAKPGAPAETGETLHRIDAQRARREIEAAGFVFEAASTVLENQHDDRSKNVMDPSIRGKTSRFIFRFRKPEERH